MLKALILIYGTISRPVQIKRAAEINDLTKGSPGRDTFQKCLFTPRNMNPIHNAMCPRDLAEFLVFVRDARIVAKYTAFVPGFYPQDFTRM